MQKSSPQQFIQPKSSCHQESLDFIVIREDTYQCSLMYTYQNHQPWWKAKGHMYCCLTDSCSTKHPVYRCLRGGCWPFPPLDSHLCVMSLSLCRWVCTSNPLCTLGNGIVKHKLELKCQPRNLSSIRITNTV